MFTADFTKNFARNQQSHAPGTNISNRITARKVTKNVCVWRRQMHPIPQEEAKKVCEAEEMFISTKTLNYLSQELWPVMVIKCLESAVD